MIWPFGPDEKTRLKTDKRDTFFHIVATLHCFEGRYASNSFRNAVYSCTILTLFLYVTEKVLLNAEE